MSPSMCKILVALSFLACSAHGRRVRPQIESDAFAQSQSLQRAINALVSARHSTAAFRVSGVGSHLTRGRAFSAANRHQASIYGRGRAFSAANRHPASIYGFRGLQLLPRRQHVHMGGKLEKGEEDRLEEGKEVMHEEGNEDEIAEVLQHEGKEGLEDDFEPTEEDIEAAMEMEGLNEEELEARMTEEFAKMREELKDAPKLEAVFQDVIPPLEKKFKLIGLDPGELEEAIKSLASDEDHAKFIGRTISSPVLEAILEALDDPEVLEDDTAVQVPSPLLFAALLATVEPPDFTEEDAGFEMSVIKLAASEMVEIDKMMRGVAPGIKDEQLRAMQVAQLCLIDASSTLSGMPLEVDDVMPQMVPQIVKLLDQKMQDGKVEITEEELQLPACLFMLQFLEEFEESQQADIQRQLEEVDEKDIEEFQPDGPTPEEMREAALSFMKWLRTNVEADDVMEMVANSIVARSTDSEEVVEEVGGEIQPVNEADEEVKPR